MKRLKEKLPAFWQFTRRMKYPQNLNPLQARANTVRHDIACFLFKREVFLNPMGTKLYLSIAHDKTVCDAFLDRFDDTLIDVLK